MEPGLPFQDFGVLGSFGGYVFKNERVLNLNILRLTWRAEKKDTQHGKDLLIVRGVPLGLWCDEFGVKGEQRVHARGYVRRPAGKDPYDTCRLFDHWIALPFQG